MIIKWRRVMKEQYVKGRPRILKDYLMTYSNLNKEHVEALNEAIKYLQNKDCARIIIEKVD